MQTVKVTARATSRRPENEFSPRERRADPTMAGRAPQRPGEVVKPIRARLTQSLGRMSGGAEDLGFVDGIVTTQRDGTDK